MGKTLIESHRPFIDYTIHWGKCEDEDYIRLNNIFALEKKSSLFIEEDEDFINLKN